MSGKIKLLHSFPPSETKFKEYCDLTFQLDQIDNTFVGTLNEVKGDILDFDLIFIHFLRNEDIQFLNEHNLDIPIVWFFWGGDFFNRGRIQNRFLLNKTKALKDNLQTRNSFKNYIKLLVKKQFPFLMDWRTDTRDRLSAINKFNYIVPVMPGDYNILQKEYNITPKIHHLNYVNPLMERKHVPWVDGGNILLGNSASFANNHMEAIDSLSQIKFSDRKIIIPLSYGNEELADYISEYAKDRLGENRVKVLRNFLPFEEYNSIINSCEILVMNHIRQQAVGNIVQALLQGSHVYLHPESTVYDYLVSQNFKVGRFDVVEELVPLQKKEQVHNRNRTREVFRTDLQRDRLEQLIYKLLTNE